jgi:heat shock protein HspQ
MSKKAKFNIGDLVTHKKQGYRAVIIDADPLFQASGRFNPQVFKRGFAARAPWYRLLVDGCTQMTYVEECCLLPDKSMQAINNPKVELYLAKNKGHYHSNIICH